MAEHDCTEAALDKLIKVVRQNERERIAQILDHMYGTGAEAFDRSVVMEMLRAEEGFSR